MSYEGLVDKRAYLNVIGCLMQDSSLIDDMDRPLSRSDFKTEDFYELLFVAIYNLYIQGCVTIDEFAIDSYLSNYKKQYKIFQDNHGLDYLVNAREIASLENYDYFYHRMRKFSLLRYYESKGVDTKRLIYDWSITDERQADIEKQKFEDYSESDIVGIIENELVITPKMDYCSDILSENIQAGDGMAELVEELLETPDFGYNFTSPFFNALCRGARRGKFYLRSASSGVGKALPNYTKIPTPVGWRNVGDIRPGDYLFGKNGKPVKVLQIHPQRDPKEIYKMHFSDGRTVECCKDHLWEYKVQSHRCWTTRVETTEEILQRAANLKNHFKDADNCGFRFRIPLNEAVEYPEKEFSVHPYVMGAMLGNGSFRYTDTNKTITISEDNEDVFVVEKIAKLLGGYVWKKNSSYNYDYSFKPSNNSRHTLWVEELLHDYPELWQLKSHEKFIPEDYLMGSVEQRYQLLQGLMDTDGHISKSKGKCSYYTMSLRLASDIQTLVRSLGMTATIAEDRRDKYKGGVGYNIRIICKKEIKNKLFTLPRKVKRANDYIENSKRKEHKDYLAIIDIEKTGIFTDMTCFTVDSDDHLFLANDFVVTHNTRNFLMDACNFAIPYTWDKKENKFVYTGHNAPTLYIGTEGSLREFQTMVLAIVSGVNETHIVEGDYDDGELDRVKEAVQYISESPLYLVYCDDFSITDIENIAKRYVLTYQVDIFIFDYIQNTMRLSNEVNSKSSMRMQEWQILLIFSTRMKALAERLDIAIISGTQLSTEAKDARYKDHTLLQGSKAIANKIDIGLILSIPNNAEKKKIEALTRNIIGCPEINLLQWCYKVRSGKISRIIILSHIDLGTMRIRDCLATDFDFMEVIPIDITRVETVEAAVKANSVGINTVNSELNQADEEVVEDEVPFEIQSESSDLDNKKLVF